MGLDYLELVMEIEATFAIDVPDADASRLGTLGDWYWYLRERLGDRSIAPADVGAPSGDLWERLLDVVQERSGLAREKLRAEAEIFRDLEID